MNGFLTVAIAHDSTCKPGEEWLFHGMASSFSKEENGEIDLPNGGCLMALAFVAFVVIVTGIIMWAIL